MQKTLYEMSEEFLKVESDIINAGGVIDDETLKRLIGIKEERAKKLESICRLLRNWESLSKSLKEEEDLLKAKRLALKKSSESLRNYALSDLQKTKIRSFVAGIFKMWRHENGATIEVIDESSIPAEFWKTVNVRSVDKEGLKNALSEGATIPGVALKKGEHLRIR